MKRAVRWRPLPAAPWQAIQVVALLLLLAGCGSPAAPPRSIAGSDARPPDSRERDGVLIHTWTAIQQGPAGPWQGSRTQLYTYVLSGDAGGDNGDGGSPSRAQARRSLTALLSEIQAGQPTGGVGDAALLARANQFIVPARGYTGGWLAIGQYDFALSAAHLNRFRLVLTAPELQARLDGLGPFFIATRQPLAELVHQDAQGQWQVDTRSPILLVDMTRAHPDAMAAYANSFRTAVREALPESTTTLAPLRARFASAVLKTAEALPLVAEAYASTSKLLNPLGAAANPP